MPPVDIPDDDESEDEFLVDDDEDDSESEDESEEEEEYVPSEIVEAEIVEEDDRSRGGVSTSNDGVCSSGNDSDAAWCPICYDNWSSQGPHQVCCLPCGHVYGFSCIEKWIRQYKRNSRECPQCKRICKLKDIIKLYVPRLAVIEGEQEKKVLSLQAEIDFLKLKIASLQEKVSQSEEEKICMEEIMFLKRHGGEILRSSLLLATHNGKCFLDTVDTGLLSATLN